MSEDDFEWYIEDLAYPDKDHNFGPFRKDARVFDMMVNRMHISVVPSKTGMHFPFPACKEDDSICSSPMYSCYRTTCRPRKFCYDGTGIFTLLKQRLSWNKQAAPGIAKRIEWEIRRACPLEKKPE